MACVKLPTFELTGQRTSFIDSPRFQELCQEIDFSLYCDFCILLIIILQDLDAWEKIFPIVEHLSNTMNTIYISGKDLSIDESMMLWRGRLVLRQYIKNKRHKYGIKLYELWESDGVVMKVRVYSGGSVVDPNLLGQTGAVVLDLMEQFLGQGYSSLHR